jgi:hypothetical protein
MKLYVWYDVEVLSQHDPGKVFVLAENKAQAINEAVKEYAEHTKDRGELLPHETVEFFEKELNEIEPIVINELAAFLEYGSD